MSMALMNIIKGTCAHWSISLLNKFNVSGKVKLFKSHRDGFKDGEQLRDFVYVKDVARVLIELADPDLARHSGIYNLGTGQARSFKDLVVATFHSMNKEVNIEYIDMPESIRHQYQYFTQADMNKLKFILPSFNPTSLETAVEDYVKNHLMKTESKLLRAGEKVYEVSRWSQRSS